MGCTEQICVLKSIYTWFTCFYDKCIYLINMYILNFTSWQMLAKRKNVHQLYLQLSPHPYNIMIGWVIFITVCKDHAHISFELWWSIIIPILQFVLKLTYNYHHMLMTSTVEKRLVSVHCFHKMNLFIKPACQHWKL